MARRPFDPADHGWTKTTYRQGDILDRDAVDALVADVDVVVHLAFIIMGSREESARINLAGTRNVFEATVAAHRPRRLVYTSSVAAYGYHSDNPVPITEDVPPRGSPEHYYSEQKAACEAALAEITGRLALEVFVLRPCIVAGPKAPALADAMPWNQLPGPVRRLTQAAAGAQAAVPGPGHTAATGPPRRRRRAIALGGHHDVRSAGCLQHRRRRRPVDVRRGRRARRTARPACPAAAAAATSEVISRCRSCRPRWSGYTSAGPRSSWTPARRSPAGLEPEVHLRRNPGGARRGLLVCSPTWANSVHSQSVDHGVTLCA